MAINFKPKDDSLTVGECDKLDKLVETHGEQVLNVLNPEQKKSYLGWKLRVWLLELDELIGLLGKAQENRDKQL